MQGLFALPVNNQTRVVTALVAYMDYPSAARIAWDHWERNRDSEARLWRLLTQAFVAKGFD
jgi:hypothetical protein